MLVKHALGVKKYVSKIKTTNTQTRVMYLYTYIFIILHGKLNEFSNIS